MSIATPIVFVVDDDPSVREAIRSLMASTGQRVETFATAREFLARPAESAPACLVLDVRLPDMNGLELQRELAHVPGSVPIVFITGHGDVEMSVRAIKAGAIEFLLKPFSDRRLLDAVDEALRLDAAQREERQAQVQAYVRFLTLTPRQREVMARVVAGRLNKQIAVELGTSEITVKLHRARAMRKMGAESLADLVRLAELLLRFKSPAARK